MTDTGKEPWLAEGLALLAEQGAQALTLDRLCERLGKTKGSFYHHFGSVPKYRTSLLAYFEAGFTAAIIDAVERSDAGSGREKLERLLLKVVLRDGPELEIAMRAWAKQDPEAKAVQARVDETRTAYLRTLCEQAGFADPDRMAKLLYVVLIGAGHLTPPLPPAEVVGMYELLLSSSQPEIG